MTYGFGYRANRPRRAALALGLPITPPVTPPAAEPTVTAPANSAPPAITGTASEGQTLTLTSVGSWTGTPAPTFAYQWRRSATDIAGATASSYVLAAADVGSTITCAVTASNSAGAATATTNILGPVADFSANANVPAKMEPPTLVASDSRIRLTIPTNTPDNGHYINRYDFRLSSDGGVTFSAPARITAQPMNLSSLVNGTTYHVQTRASNVNGPGPWSDSATATPVAP